MALYCPVTGLKVFTKPEWINQKVSDTFIANFWIIGRSILYSRPKGHADLQGVQNSSALRGKIANSILGGHGPYVQIQDYALLRGSSSAARKYYAEALNDDNRLLSLFFCNLSPPLSVAVKIGKRFNKTGKRIHIARHYKDAVKRAIEIESQEELSLDNAALELCKCLGEKDRSLTPVDVLCQDDWQIQTPGYTNQAVILDKCILHSTSEGYLSPEHIPLIERMRSQCQSALAEGSALDYFVVDSSKVEGTSRLARIQFMQSLRNWHKRFPIRLYIIYGANTFVKTAMHLGKTLLPFKVVNAKNVKHAFRLIEDDKSGNISNNLAKSEYENPVVVAQNDIENLMALIGSIDWEQKGVHYNFDLNKDHPFYFLNQSIRLIKEESDALFTEQKQLEEQLHQSRKLESIGTLAGGVAHDFNNILHMIIGNTQLALEDIPEEHPAHSSLVSIKAAGLRAAGITRQLLNFSRKTDQSFKPIDFIAIVEDSVQLLRSTIPATIEMCKHLLTTNATILADPIQINQVMINICTNAVQAMEESSGVIEVIVEKEDLLENSIGSSFNLKAGEYVKMMIKDSGPGIEPEIIDRIFDPYYTTKEIGKGTGMGLAVVHGIVKNHGGTISVESHTGKGATFIVRFPKVAKTPVAEATTVDEKSFGNERILLVDDEASIVDMTAMMLARLGYEVETRTNPRDALKLFQSKPNDFDLIITDMAMPHMSGIVLSEKIKIIRSDIPIVICTGYSQIINREKAKDMGIAAYLLKPFDMSAVAKTIRGIFDVNEGTDQ